MDKGTSEEEIIRPQFKEKQFLSVLLSELSHEYGEHRRHVETHKFSLADNELADRIGHNQWSEQYRKLNLEHWVREAKSRKLVDIKSSHFVITLMGYEQARECKEPVKSFIKNEWRYAITTGISILALVIAIFAILLK
jgi:hypothetical protein